MNLIRLPYRSFLLLLLVFFTGLGSRVLQAQHLENGATGRVKNNGTIRFKSDTGRYKNDALYSSITNNVIEFQGRTNLFTDLGGRTANTTVLGQDRNWRVPGLVRYAKAADNQSVQARFYTDLEMKDGATKDIPDSVLVGRAYSIVLSGSRTYHGTFYYDGTQPQFITEERGLSGNVNRYNNLSLLFSPKTVADSSEVRVDNLFDSDVQSPLFVLGDMYWGTKSNARAHVRINDAGQLVTGSDTSRFHDSATVINGTLLMPDRAGVAVVMPSSSLALVNDGRAMLVMGTSTQMDVLGSFVNRHVPLTNVQFDTSSLVNYDGTQPQIIQATASSKPYGSLRTARSAKTASGDVFMATNLSVNDTNVVMLPYTLSMKIGTASYTNNAEVVGALRRELAGGDTVTFYRYNNEETGLRFSEIPRELTLDVRPRTRPNAFDPTTDIFRKITARYDGTWRALVRAGYKADDLPGTWAPESSERLLKMYNASPSPNETATKLTPTIPPTYQRRPLAQSTGLAYIELSNVSSNGPDNSRVDNGNDMLLRGSRDVLRAIASGRWSNPFTWDEAREPEPVDRVVIDGFTVHAGYVRANDNYAVREKYSDSLATEVMIGVKPNSTLLIGREGTFNTFSLVPTSTVLMYVKRQARALVPMLAQDTSAADIDGGLVVYPGALLLVPNLTVETDATVFNAGTLQVGQP